MKIRRRGQNLQTRYAYTRTNLRIVTSMLELAAGKLRDVALGSETPEELAAFGVECERIVKECGIQERGR